MKAVTIIVLVASSVPNGFAQSTSPAPQPVPLAIQPAGSTITFSELPLGTTITSQYQDRGIVFGPSPYITRDGANPTSPVLSGRPQFMGPITGQFVEPGTGRSTVVESFSFDAGYFDNFGSTRIQWFDPNGKVLGQRINSRLGIENLRFSGGNIASWRIEVVASEPAGYAIDNVSSEPAAASVLFREQSLETKEGTWGLRKDEIPGFDHAAFHIGNRVYESHPGYRAGAYISADGKESAPVSQIDGVQAQHTKATFRHDSTSGSTGVIGFEEIPIPAGVASSMRDSIETVVGRQFQRIDYSLSGLERTLAPFVQKGGNGSFTCVGLVEWAAERAGQGGGQGFIPDKFESITVPDLRSFPPKSIIVPLLSPQLLNYAMKGQSLLSNAKQWIQGLFDPVDFMIIDPLGRRLGFVQNAGLLREIPHAFYSGNGGVEQVLIPNAVPGKYTIILTGTGAESFMGVAGPGAAESYAGFLPVGQTVVKQIVVVPSPGSMGDVNGDGVVNSGDLAALNLRLNRFTDGLSDPGDLDGDGLLSMADVTLLNRLIVALTAPIQLPVAAFVAPGLSAPFPVTLAAPAGADGAWVTLSSSDPGKVALTPANGAVFHTVVPPGSIAPVYTPKVYGAGFGSATITAFAPSLGPASGVVVRVGASIEFTPASVTVPLGIKRSLVLRLSAPAPAGGVAFSIVSSNPLVAAVPSTVTIPGDAVEVSVPVAGAGVGTAAITASAGVPNIAATAAMATVVAGSRQGAHP